MVAFGYKNDGIKHEEKERGGNKGADNKGKAWKTKYPHNNVQKEKCGHIFERDSTPDAERISLRHCSGSGFEYIYDGTKLSTTVGNSYEYVKGGKTSTVERGYDSKVAGNRRDLVDGGYHGEVKGNHTMAIAGDSATAHGGSHTIQSASSYNIGAAKSVTMTSGNNKTRISLDPNGTCTIASEGDVCIQSKGGKLTLKGESVHIAAGSLELGFTKLKVPKFVWIPLWRVGQADVIPGTYDRIKAEVTEKPDQDGINQGSHQQNEQQVIAGYTESGTQDA